MIQFNDLTIGQEVFINVGDDYIGADRRGWLAVMVNCLIGDCEPNPGRTLVEVVSPWLECGWHVTDVDNLYPAPDYYTTYKMVDVVERVSAPPRTYEFGIGGINQADDPYYSYQETRPTGRRKMILLGKCAGCGCEFPKMMLMSSSSGTACPDCYDRMSE